MQLIQIARGYRGVRQLAGARAEIELRRLGYVPKIKYPHSGSNKTWTDEEYDEAIAMRLSGMSHGEIAAATGRTRMAIDRQLGAEVPKVSA